MAHLLGAEALHLEYPTRIVFDSVSLGVAEGDRIGIVGRNGDGKSSLLGMLTGHIQPSGGRVTVRGGVRIGVLAQHDTLDDDDSIGHTIVGDAPEYVWAGDARIRDVIAGLVADLDWDARIGTLSGGQRRRVDLAALLVQDLDVLALDEPTNHLDVEGIAWLAGHMKTRWATHSGALLVVTHDRWFLDEVCTDTWEVHDGTVEPFEGGYAAYILQRVERDRQAAAIEARRQNLARRELAWLRRGAPARTAKPKFRIEAANELIADVPPLRDSVGLQALATARLGKDVVDLLGASVSFTDPDGGGVHEVLRGVEWRIAPGERTGILGVNGAGKSTLLGLVDGRVQPTAGRVKRGKTVQVAALSQRMDELDEHLGKPVRVVLDTLRTTYTFGSGSKATELSPGQLLEQMGFSSTQLSTPVKDLSGGQKRRLQLLLVLLAQPNVLILDEPTNDLDTDMLAAMEELLDSWPGTLLVVSHDRYFLERVTDQQYGILDGHFRHLPGGVDEYLRLRGTERTAAHRSAAAATAAIAGASAHAGAHTGAATAVRSPASAALSGADRRAAQKEVSAIDRRLQKLQRQIAGVDARLAASHDDYTALIDLQRSRDALTTETAGLEERWLQLAEQLEG